MKHRFLSLAAMFVLATASTALAQAPAGSGGGAPNRAAQRMQMMMNGITLTPVQQTSIDSIVAAYQTQMPAMTPGQRPDSAAMATRRETMMRRDRDIRAVLTPDQQKVFDNNVETMRANMPGRP